MKKEQTNTTKLLREGFTTGTAATAAAMAALHALLGKEIVQSIVTPLPPQETAIDAKIVASLCISIENISILTNNSATATVRKDGGDDPDVTHKACIVASVYLCPHGIHIEGGAGVGTVTLPGLPVPVGEAAINPAPRKQILLGLQSVAKDYAYTGGIRLVISVPDGERIARKTFNPRLGIVGGISILGTQGIVRPYSHAAWQATIAQGLNVAAAAHCSTICLSTGRRSERLLLAQYPTLPPYAAVQVADFAQFALQKAGALPFQYIVWGCFFGKLVKLAQGHTYTHAHTATLDFQQLYQWCADMGLHIPEIRHCVTASHALELLLPHAQSKKVLFSLTQRAAQVATNFAKRSVHIHLFHLNGQELAYI